VYSYTARPKIEGSSWAAKLSTFLKWCGSGWPTRPNTITPFGSVLGLTVKPKPTAFDKEGNAPNRVWVMLRLDPSALAPWVLPLAGPNALKKNSFLCNFFIKI
jgi:hypothetical protein